MANAFTPEQIAQILEEFFKTVGARQYIGARYVPIFGRKDETSIEWDNTKPYEPLTIVLYQGNSYTSRQYVPAGVQITNNEFWAITGNYNAQIEEYRRETARALQAAQNAQGDIDTLLPKADFSAENTVKDYIDAAKQSADNAQESADNAQADIDFCVVNIGEGMTLADVQTILNDNIGKMVVFPKAHTFQFDATLLVPQGSKIDFRDSEIERVENVHDVIRIVDGTNTETVIRNLKIDGRMVADNLSAEQAADRFSGIKASGKERLRFENVQIRETVNGEYQAEGINGAIALASCTHIIIDSCLFEDNDRTAVMLDECAYAIISNCIGRDNNGSLLTGICNEILVENCEAYNSGYSGISCNGSNICYVGCISDGAGYSAFNIGHAESKSDGCVINCTGRNATLDGVTFTNAKGIIANCLFEDNTRNDINAANCYGRVTVINTECIGNILRATASEITVSACAFSECTVNIYTDANSIINCEDSSFAFTGLVAVDCRGDGVFSDCKFVGSEGVQNQRAFNTQGNVQAVNCTRENLVGFSSSNTGVKIAYGHACDVYVSANLQIFKLPFNNICLAFAHNGTFTQEVPAAFAAVARTNIENIEIVGTTFNSTYTDTNWHSMMYIGVA